MPGLEDLKANIGCDWSGKHHLFLSFLKTTAGGRLDTPASYLVDDGLV